MPTDDFPLPGSVEDLETVLRALERFAADPDAVAALSPESRARLLGSAGRIAHPDRKERRERQRRKIRETKYALDAHDRSLRASTEIRTVRKEAVYAAPPRRIAGPAPADPAAPREFARERNCYVCKTPYREVHFFYDSMCSACGDFNYAKRFQTASLAGRVAIITGARLKIGYHAALLMLRAGARVIVTTRFPNDSAERFAREPDFAEWGARLQIYGLDLRHAPSVEAFAEEMNERLDRLDLLINNAAQTVRRPPGFYAHLMERELAPPETLRPEARALLIGFSALKERTAGTADAGTLIPTAWSSRGEGATADAILGLTHSAILSQIPHRADSREAAEANSVFPAGRLDADLQQVDERAGNTWRTRLADVTTSELLEVQLVNSIAPFILCAKLKPLMMRDRTNEKHIVNVSAMEGKFTRYTKTDRHPHTNMAKAALNMLTRTSASDYENAGIHMNAVDTGWVTDEDPAEISARKTAVHDFEPPLDIVDGAARICDPFFSGLITGTHVWGKFLKDYAPTSW